MELNHNPPGTEPTSRHILVLPPSSLSLASGQQESSPCFTGVLQGALNYKHFEDEKHLLVVCFIQLSE